MNKIINLELHDKHAYKEPFKATWKDLNNIDIIFEILGSVENSDSDLEINIVLKENNLFIYHNDKPIDETDIERLLDLATHKLNKNRKGLSKQGVGWRAVATVSSNRNFNEGYNQDFFYEYSSMLSKVNTDININDICGKKDDIISLIHDNDFQISFRNGDFYDKIYHTFLKDKYGVLFIIPFNNNLTKHDDFNIEHKLKLLFNRLDCQLYYENEITKYSKQIFKDKPFYYVDNSISDNKYLEIKCEIFTYFKKKILKMNIIHSKNIIDPNNEIDISKDHYFWINTHKNIDEVMQKYEYDDWSYNIEDFSKLEPDNYVFQIRMMGFDSDKHNENEDFKKWFKYYTPHKTKGGGIEGFGDGIIPYINNNCLKYSSDASQKGYLKQANFYPSKRLLIGNGWQGVDSGTHWKRTIDHKTIIYKKNQNFLCEYIEGKNTDSDKSILTINPIKSKTGVCDTTQSKGCSKTIPFFLLWLSHKYLWDVTEEIIELTSEQKQLIAEQKAEAEYLRAEEEKKLKIIAEQIAEEERQRAEQEKKKKIIAEQQSEEDKQKKIIAEEQSKAEEIKKKKSLIHNENMRQLMELQSSIIQESNDEKDELQKSIENEYISINEEINVNEGHCYCMFDPTRPKWRKIGRTAKSKDGLTKQYIPRYMPIQIDIIQWTSFNNSKLAEKHIFEKLKKYRYNTTEWFIFNNYDNEYIDNIIKQIFTEYDNFINS